MQAPGLSGLGKDRGRHPALVAESGVVLSYEELAGRASEQADQLRRRQARLVLIAGDNDIDTIVAWLACLEAGVPAILGDAADAAPDSRIRTAFRPDAVLARSGEGWQWVYCETEGAHPHPDLALLLSTSGSTGSPKLVRLSRRAVEANARSIVTYLGIAPGDRAILSLPMRYSYGLSVINSHLLAGATLLVTRRSVGDRAFLQFAREAGATSLAGVPYTYDLLDRLGFRDDPPPTLRTLTQAGGRLAPDRVRSWARWSETRGVRFFVMYGATEATARMAYLPPELALRHPDCIGVPIPGGSLHLEDAEGRPIVGTGETGELVYRGPNVMMGYAHERAELARGQELSELRTGDLAERTPEGLFRITGRIGRFAKIGGKRIGFDDLEALLAGWGRPAVVTGDDDRIAVCLPDARDDAEARSLARRLADAAGLPASAPITVLAGEVPRLPSGKPDYAAIRAAAAERAERFVPQVPDPASPVARALALATGRSDIGPNDSFHSLGGDSLSHVQASLELERALGHLPEGWERMTVRQLEKAKGPPARTAAAGWRTVPTEWVLRVVALTLVILNHALLPMRLPLPGGAMLLMVLVGYSLAAGHWERLLAGRATEVFATAFLRYAPLYYGLVLTIAPVTARAEIDLPTLLMVTNWTGKTRDLFLHLWFLEAFFQILLVICLLFLLKPVRQLGRDRPGTLAALLVALGLGAMILGPRIVATETPWGTRYSADAHFIYVAIGILAFFVRGWSARLLVVALLLLVAGFDRGFDSSRGWIASAGLLVLLLRPEMRLPRRAARLVTLLAAATFVTYVVHLPVVRLFEYLDGPRWWAPLALVISFALGILGFRLWSEVLVFARSLLSRVRAGGLPALIPAVTVRAGGRPGAKAAAGNRSLRAARGRDG